VHIYHALGSHAWEKSWGHNPYHGSTQLIMAHPHLAVFGA
jgi:hypothetical protein